MTDDGSEAKERKCPYCGALQFIDPAGTAKAITCENPKCGQTATFGAWCNPATSPNYVAIAETTSTSFTEELIRHSIAYTTDADGGGVASGTLVSLGDHFLIATTAHTIPDNIRHVGLVGKDVPTTGDRSRWVMAAGKDAMIDVGFIDVLASAIDDLNVAPITLGRLVDAGAGSPILKTRVVGYPWESRHDNLTPGIRAFTPFSYGCEPVHTAAWRTVNVENIDPLKHVLAHYEQEDNIDWRRDYVQSAPAPDPHGMSGGGYWQRPALLDDNVLWQPYDLKLCAIQSAWYRKKSFIKGVQIIYWVKLLAEHYPELADELRNQFPRLNRLSPP